MGSQVLAGVDSYAVDLTTLSFPHQSGRLWQSSSQEIIALLDASGRIFPPAFDQTDWDKLLADFTVPSDQSLRPSFFLARLDRQARLDYHSVNYPPQLLLKTGGIILEIGTPEDSSRPEVNGAALQLDSGDLVLLYSPGLVNLKNFGGEDFGLMHLKSLLLQNQHRSSEEIGLTIAQAAWLHHGQITIPSQTLMILKVRP